MVNVNLDNNTSLYLAVKESNLEAIKYFIEKRADINAKDEYNYTPLHYAIESGNSYIVKFLIDKGAMTDDDGSTSLFFAFQHGSIESVKYYMEEKCVDPTMAINKYGGTLLHEACAYHNLEVVKYLLDKKKVAYDGKSLLSVTQDLDIVKYLVGEKEVNPNFADKYGWTPLLFAVERNDLEVIEYLVEKGADINARSKGGATVLHVAASGFRIDPEIIEYLVKKGADINAVDNEGNTPLHLAVKENKYQNNDEKLGLIKWLVNSGACKKQKW